jgi:flagellar biosynthetic protein FliO
MKNFRWPTLLSGATILGSKTLLADDQPVPALTGDIGPTLLQLAGALIFIVVLIYVSVWLMKKYSVGKIVSGGNLINVVERRNLTAKQAIYLIKVGEKHILVGATDSGMSKIADIDALEVRQLSAAKTDTGIASKFSQILKGSKSSLMPMFQLKEKSLET